MACNHEEIWKTVVVEVNDACSPAHVTSFNAQARGPGSVLEIRFPVVVIKDVGIVREVRLEYVEMSVEGIIADADAHTRLFHAIIAQGSPAQHSFFTKRSISIIHE